MAYYSFCYQIFRFFRVLDFSVDLFFVFFAFEISNARLEFFGVF